MTKPQIWVAAFLAIFILLFLLSRIINEDNTSQSIPEDNAVPQSNLSSEELTAKELINRVGCITCHGPDLQGATMGPDLHGVGKFWSRDRLISYLRNPQSFMDQERFRAYQEKYPQVIMPPYNHVDIKDLGKIADYILDLN